MKTYNDLNEFEIDIYNHILECKHFRKLTKLFSPLSFDTIYTCSCGEQWSISDFALKPIKNFNTHWLNYITSDSNLYKSWQQTLKNEREMQQKQVQSKIKNSFSMLKLDDLE